MSHNCIFTILAVLLIAPARLSAQIVEDISSEVIVVCDDEGGTFNTRLTNSGPNQSNLRIQICLGEGQEYLTGSLVQTEGPTLTHDPISPDRAPIFTASGTWNMGASLEFSFAKQGGCDARTAKINGVNFVDTLKVFSGTTPLELTGQDTAVYDVVYAELTTEVLSTSPVSISLPGQTVTRRVRITNGSFGFIDSLLFGEVDESGELLYSNFILDPDGAAVSLGDGTVTGNSVEVTINSAQLSMVAGLTGGILNTNESIVLEYDIIVDSCEPEGVATDVFSAYGCFGELCQSDTTVANVGVALAQPDLQILSEQIVGPCFGYDEAPDTFRVTLTNVGDGPAIDPSILYRVARTEWGGIDTMNITYTLNGGMPVDIAAAQFFAVRGTENTNRFGCEDQEPSLGVGNLANFGVRINFPDTLQAGDALTVQLLYYKCCPDVCVQDNFFGFARFGGINTTETQVRYNNFCENNLIVDELPGESRTFAYDNTVSLPTTFFVGDTKPGRIDFPVLRGANDFNSQDGYLELRAKVPDCLDPSNVNVIISGDNIPATPLITITDDSIVQRINLFDNGFDFDGSAITFDLTTDCIETCTDMNFSYEIIWVPSSGADCNDECGIILSCESFGVAINCPAPCEGAAYREYEFLRTNIGSFDMDDNGCPDDDNDCDGTPGGGPVAPAPDTAALALDRVIRGDTVVSRVKLVINDTVPIQNFDYLYSQDYLDLGIFTPIGNTITVFPAAGGTFSAEDVAFATGTDVVGYDLSPGQVPDWGAVEYVDGDSVVFEAFYLVGPTGTNVAMVTEVDNQISATNVEDPTLTREFDYDIIDFACGDVAGSILVNDFIWETTSGTRPIRTSCNRDDLVGSWRLALSPGEGAGINYFPQEYRNLALLTALRGVVPPGYRFESARIRIDRTAGSGLFDRSPIFELTPSSITTSADGFEIYDFDLTVAPNSDYLLTAFPPDDGFTLLFDFFVTPTCEAEGPFQSAGTTNQTFADILTFEGEMVRRLANFSGEYLPPSLLATTTAAVQIGRGPTVTWPLNLANNSPSTPADNVWLAIVSPSGLIGVDSLELLSLDNGSTIVTPDANGFYRLGDYATLEDSSYQITASYGNCLTDSLLILYGWDCGMFPTSLADLADACVDTLALQVQPQRAAVSLNVTPLADTPIDPANPGAGDWNMNEVTMCEPFPVEIRIISGAQGFVFDPSIQILNPFGGGTAGLDYIAGSGYIEYPVGTAPRQFDPAADADIFAQNGTAGFDFTLAEIDPTEIGMVNDSFLPGVTEAPLNQAIIRLEFQPNCDITSGERFRVAAFGEEVCGRNIQGNGERVLGFPIDIEGAMSPYINNLALNLTDSISICPDSLLTIELGISHIGAQPSNENTDSIVLILPPYAEEVDFNDLDCGTAFCPVLPAMVTTRPDGLIEVKYALPSGMENMDTLGFSFQVAIADTIGCSFPEGQIIEAQTTVASEVFCDDIGGNCPGFQSISGSALDSFRTFQPSISLVNVMVNCLEDGSFIYDGQITVDSFPVLDDDQINLDFFCLDANGIPEATPAYTTTINGPILVGDTVDIMGNFSALCDPANGIYVAVAKENNCVCATVENTVIVEKCPSVNIDAPLDGSTVCGTDSVAFTAEILGTVPATFSWVSSGDGTFSDATILNPVYRPARSDQGKVVTFELVAIPPAGNVCPADTARIQIEFLKVDCGQFPWGGQ